MNFRMSISKFLNASVEFFKCRFRIFEFRFRTFWCRASGCRTFERHNFECWTLGCRTFECLAFVCRSFEYRAFVCRSLGCRTLHSAPEIWTPLSSNSRYEKLTRKKWSWSVINSTAQTPGYCTRCKSLIMEMRSNSSNSSNNSNNNSNREKCIWTQMALKHALDLLECYFFAIRWQK